MVTMGPVDPGAQSSYAKEKRGGLSWSLMDNLRDFGAEVHIGFKAQYTSSNPGKTSPRDGFAGSGSK